jgi:hypothetical protein
MSLEMQIMLTDVRLLILKFNILIKALQYLNSAQKQFHIVSKNPVY